MHIHLRHTLWQHRLQQLLQLLLLLLLLLWLGRCHLAGDIRLHIFIIRLGCICI
jgi:hypothetical protein